MDEDKSLEGLNYQKLELHDHVHKICGKVTKVQGEIEKEFEITPGTFWLINGLGQFSNEIVDEKHA